MTLQVRRIVTGHDANGKAVVASDEQLTAVSRRIGANITGCEIWSTDSMPVNNSPEAEAEHRAGFVKRYNYVGTGQGVACRITEWAPGHARFTHRTETVDFAILLSGEIDMELDDGQVVHLKPGDGTVGKVWIMDRGMASAENIDWLRESGRRYIVGTPKSEVRKWAPGAGGEDPMARDPRGH